MADVSQFLNEPRAQIVNHATGEALLSGRTGREYHLVFDLAAVAQLEAQMGGRSVLDLIQSRPGVTNVLQMMVVGSAGYARRNPGANVKPLNPNLAMKVMADCGGYANIADVVLESLTRAEGLGLFPDAEAGSDDVDPPPGPGPAL